VTGAPESYRPFTP